MSHPNGETFLKAPSLNSNVYRYALIFDTKKIFSNNKLDRNGKPKVLEQFERKVYFDLFGVPTVAF